MRNQLQDAFDTDRIQDRIQDAFDLIRADQQLIDRTRQRLIEAGGRPDLGVRIDRERQRQQRFRRQLAAAVSVFVLACVILAGMVVINTPVAAVSMDLDRAVILEVNRLNRVVRVTLHASGSEQRLASDSAPQASAAIGALKDSLRQQTVEKAVTRLVTAAANAPDTCIDENGATIITLSTSADSLNMQVDLGQRVETAAALALEANGRQAVLYMEYTGYARVQEARQLDITPGRLNLVRKLVELAPDTLVSDCTALDNTAIMRLVVDKIQAGAQLGSKPATAGGNGNGLPGQPAGSSASGNNGQAPAPNGNAQTPGGIGQNGVTAPDGGLGGQKGDAGSQGGVSNSNGNDVGNGSGAPTGNNGVGKPNGSAGANGNDVQNGNGNAYGNGNSNGNGNGNSNGNGNGNGNGNAYGYGNGLKPGQNGNGQPGTSPFGAEASLQRMRQALARSAENAKRHGR